MAGLEKKIFEKSEFKTFVWLRYLDDIFTIWSQGHEKLNEFFDYLNNLHVTIKFTMDYSATEINLLDVTVAKVGNILERYLYCKPTDTHQYLHAQSCRRNIYKNSIAYGQAIRIKRIC